MSLHPRDAASTFRPGARGQGSQAWRALWSAPPCSALARPRQEPLPAFSDRRSSHIQNTDSSKAQSSSTSTYLLPAWSLNPVNCCLYREISTAVTSNRPKGRDEPEHRKCDCVTANFPAHQAVAEGCDFLERCELNAAPAEQLLRVLPCRPEVHRAQRGTVTGQRHLGDGPAWLPVESPSLCCLASATLKVLVPRLKPCKQDMACWAEAGSW